MKKLFYILVAVLLLGACDPKHDIGTNVEKTVVADYKYMQDNYDIDFVWYESSITLDNFLDEEECSVFSVNNIFQTMPLDYDTDMPTVVMFNHCGDIIQHKELQGWWTEDIVLNPEEINYSYDEAYKRLMQADIIKPHSKFCVLRKPLGPYPCNAQYIFGNANSTLIFVDALTGDVSSENPAFNRRE